ncbi:MAG TPA: hypothetical protein VKI62_00040 [Bacteroidota bacterium]|nr:hypothetical protein [Bacteroidota bacterium]
MEKGITNVRYQEDRYFDVRHLLKIPSMLTIGRFVFGRRGQMYHISCIELNRDGVYLTFPQGTLLTEGEIFRMVRPLGSYKYDYFSFGCPRNIVAKVKVLKIAGNGRVRVQVLKGTVTNGVSAERIG